MYLRYREKLPIDGDSVIAQSGNPQELVVQMSNTTAVGMRDFRYTAQSSQAKECGDYMLERHIERSMSLQIRTALLLSRSNSAVTSTWNYSATTVSCQVLRRRLSKPS